MTQPILPPPLKPIPMKVRERRRRYQQPESFRVFKPDGDPFEERIEFHIRKQ